MFSHLFEDVSVVITHLDAETGADAPPQVA
jgi:hypothetical protein